MKNIYQSKSVTKNGKRYELKELSYVFDCPHCEYLLTTLDEDSARATRRLHYFSAHSDYFLEAVYEDAEERTDEHFQVMRQRIDNEIKQMMRAV